MGLSNTAAAAVGDQYECHGNSMSIGTSAGCYRFPQGGAGAPIRAGEWTRSGTSDASITFTAAGGGFYRVLSASYSDGCGGGFKPLPYAPRFLSVDSPVVVTDNRTSQCSADQLFVRFEEVEPPITKVDDVDPVSVGGKVTYTIKVQYVSDLTNFLVEDIIPAGITWDAVAPTNNANVSCTAKQVPDRRTGGFTEGEERCIVNPMTQEETCFTDPNSVTYVEPDQVDGVECQYNGTLAANQPTSFTLTFDVPANYSGPNPFTNRAQLVGSDNDAQTLSQNGNQLASTSEDTRVTQGGLSIEKNCVTLPAGRALVPTMPLRCDITINNTSTAAATGELTITDTPQSNLIYDDVGSGDNTFDCNPSGANAICRGNTTVPAGGSVTFPIFMQVTANSPCDTAAKEAHNRVKVDSQFTVAKSTADWFGDVTCPAQPASCSAAVTNTMVPRGDAVRNGTTNEIVLTPNDNQKRGQVWSINPIDLRQPFTLTFDINLGTLDADGADGIAFTLQSEGNQAVGIHGATLGSGGLVPSFGVEFDTYRNHPDVNPNNAAYDDPVEDHTAIFTNGDFTPAGRLGGVHTQPNLEDGQYRTAEVSWNPTTKVFTYKLDGVTIDSVTNDIVANYFNGNPSVHYGYTASTGGFTNEQKVCLKTLISTPYVPPNDEPPVAPGGQCSGTPVEMDVSVSDSDQQQGANQGNMQGAAVGWTHNIPADRYQPVFNPADYLVQDASREQVGSGLTQSVDRAHLRLSGADQDTWPLANGAGDYITGSFKTSEYLSDHVVLRQMRYRGGIDEDQYNATPGKFTLLMSTNANFSDAWRVTEDETYVDGTFAWQQVALRPYKLQPNTTYYWRVVVYDMAVPTGDFLWDDFVLYFGRCPVTEPGTMAGNVCTDPLTPLPQQQGQPYPSVYWFHNDQTDYDKPTFDAAYFSTAEDETFGPGITQQQYFLQTMSMNGIFETSWQHANASGDYWTGSFTTRADLPGNTAISEVSFRGGHNDASPAKVTVLISTDPNFGTAWRVVTEAEFPNNGTEPLTPPTQQYLLQPNTKYYWRYLPHSVTDRSKALRGDDFRVKIATCGDPNPPLGGPFECTADEYVIADNPSKFYRVNKSTSPYTLTELFGRDTLHNALAYGPDNYLYTVTKYGGEVYRVAKDGTEVSLGNITDNDVEVFTGGTFDEAGNYWVTVKGEGEGDVGGDGLTSFMLRLSVAGNQVQILDKVTLSVRSRLGDLAYNPIDGRFYAYENDIQRVVRLSTNGTVTNIGPVSTQVGGTGAVWFDSLGQFYIYVNSTGEIFRATSPTQPFTLVGMGPLVPNNDGASCTTAPKLEKNVSPQEVTAGEEVEYSFRFGNATGNTQSATLSDTLTFAGKYVANSFTITPAPLGQTLNNYGGTNAFSAQLQLDANTSYEVKIRVMIDFSANAGTVTNQADLMFGNVTVESDYPETPVYGDPTPLKINAQSVGGPFNCPAEPFLIYNNPSKLARLNMAAEPFTLTDIGNLDELFNGLAYGPDNYLYMTGSDSYKVVRMASDGSTQVLGLVDTGGTRVAGGTFDGQGRYLVLSRKNFGGGNVVAKLTVLAINGNTFSTISQVDLSSTEMYDIAYNPIDGKIYGYDIVEKRLAEVNVTTGAVTHIGAVSDATGTGSIFFDSIGDTYIYDNATSGRLLRSDGVSGNFVQVGSGPTVTNSDATSCFAPKLSKNVSPKTIQRGEIVEYTFRFANITSQNQVVELTDTLANGRSYIGGSLTITPNPVNQNIDPYDDRNTLKANLELFPNTSYTVKIRVQTRGSGASGILENQAQLKVGNDTVLSDYPDSPEYGDPTPLEVLIGDQTGYCSVGVESSGGVYEHPTYGKIKITFTTSDIQKHDNWVAGGYGSYKWSLPTIWYSGEGGNSASNGLQWVRYEFENPIPADDLLFFPLHLDESENHISFGGLPPAGQNPAIAPAFPGGATSEFVGRIYGADFSDMNIDSLSPLLLSGQDNAPYKNPAYIFRGRGGNLNGIYATTFADPAVGDGFNLFMAIKGDNCPQVGPDLRMKKTVADGATPGAPFDYILTISNAGTLDATGITINETLPNGMQFVGIDQGFTCNANNVCTNAGLTIAAGATLEVRYTVSAAGNGPFTNKACVLGGDDVSEDCDEVTHSLTPLPPWQCDGGLFLVRKQDTEIVKVNVANDGTYTSQQVVPPMDGLRFENSLGYNPVDNYLYSTGELNGVRGTVFRVASNGQRAVIGQLKDTDGSPLHAYGGTFDDQGNYWVISTPPGVVRLWKVNVNTTPITQEFRGNITGGRPDIAFNPIDGKMYAYNGDIRFVIMDTNGADTPFGKTYADDLNSGAYAFDNNGRMYLFTQDGRILEADVGVNGNGTGEVWELANGLPGTELNADAASCVGAPLAPTNPQLGVAKKATVTGDTATIDFTIENLGNVRVEKVSLIDNLNATFGVGNFSIQTAPSFVTDPGSLTLNPNFNGADSANLLVPDNSFLVPDQPAVIRVVVKIRNAGHYENVATVIGEYCTPSDPSDCSVTIDASTDGTNPDPNGNGNPSDPDEDIPTPITVNFSGTPFSCTGDLFISQRPPTMDSGMTLKTIDQTTSPYTLADVSVHDFGFNGIGFNSLDGFVYGSAGAQIEGTTQYQHLMYRIGSNGAVQQIHISTPGQLATNAGDVDEDGFYWVLPFDRISNVANTILKFRVVGLNKAQLVETVDLDVNVRIDDLAFNPQDGLFYSYDRLTARFFRLSKGGTISFFGATQTFGGPLGAHYFDSTGQYFVYDNSGEIFKVDTVTAAATSVSPAPEVFANDGASCWAAPQLAKEVTPTTVTAGQEVTYSFTFANPVAANRTYRIADTLANGRLYVANSLTSSTGGPAPTPNAYAGTNQLSFDVTMPPRSSHTYTVRVKIPDTAEGTLVNQATLTFDGQTVQSDYPPTPEYGDPTPLVVEALPVPPWSCDSSLYVVGEVDARIHRVVVANDGTVTNTLVVPPTGIHLNGLGYNPVDDLLYAINIEDGPGRGDIYRIGSDGTLQMLGKLTDNAGAPVFGLSATFDLQGTYIVSDDLARVWHVDITQTPPTRTQVGTLAGGRADIAFNAEDGKAYSYDATSQRLTFFDPNNPNETAFGIVHNPGLVGGAVASGGGRFFLYDKAGKLVETDIGTNGSGSGSAWVVAENLPAISQSIDATSCPTGGPIVPANAKVGIAKAASVNGDIVTLDFRLENLGNVPVNELEVLDDLNATFGAGYYEIHSAPAFINGDDPGTIALSPLFGTTTNGNLHTEMTQRNNSRLLPQRTATIRVQVKVLVSGSFENQAFVRGVYCGGSGNDCLRPFDRSDDGTDPDPNGDGDPSGPDENDPTPIVVDVLGGPFNCVANDYVITGNPSVFNVVDKSAAQYGLNQLFASDYLFNALAYGPDDYLYGVEWTTGNVLRIAADGSLQLLGTIQLNTNQHIPGGTFDGNGDYVVFTATPGGPGADGIIRLRLNGNEIDEVSRTALSAATPLGDIAYNPIDGKIYGFTATSNVEIQANGNVNTVSTQTAVGGAGSVWFDSLGQMYVYQNNPGKIFRATDPTQPYVEQGSGTSVPNSDGASCTNALSLEKTVAPTSAVPGQIVTYTYRTSNPTSGQISVDFKDALPDDRAFVANSLQITPNTAHTPNAYADSSTLSITGLSMAANTVYTITADVRVPNYGAVSTVFNQAVLDNVPTGLGPSSIPSDFPATGIFGDPTPLNVDQLSRIGVAKTVDIDQSSGTPVVTINLRVKAYGTRLLRNVELLEDLDGTFGAGNYTLVSVTEGADHNAPNLTRDTGYNGQAATSNLLAGSSTLSAGQTGHYVVVVNVTRLSDQGNGLGAYTNTAYGRATVDGVDPNDPAYRVTDESDNGTDPDPNNNGDPTEEGPGNCPSTNPNDGCENDSTPITLQVNPQIGIAKQVTVTGDGPWEITFDLYVENLGDVAFDRVTVLDDLDNVFVPDTYSISQPPTLVSGPTTLEMNTNYTGKPLSPNVVVPSNSSLAPSNDDPAKVVHIRFKVTTAFPGSFANQASVRGQYNCFADSPQCLEANDVSDSGTDADPDGDGDPSENDGNCPSNDPNENCEDDPSGFDITGLPKGPTLACTRTPWIMGQDSTNSCTGQEGCITNLYELDQSTDPFAAVLQGQQTDVRLDALGHYYIDGYLYGLAKYRLPPNDKGLREYSPYYLVAQAADGSVSPIDIVSGYDLSQSIVWGGDMDAEGNFWAIVQTGNDFILLKIDVTNGEVTSAMTSTEAGFDLAFNANDGKLYGYNPINQFVWRYDPASDAFDQVVQIVPPETMRLDGLWFDAAGKLYGYDTEDNKVWNIGLTDGAVTLLSTADVPGGASPQDAAICHAAVGFEKTVMPKPAKVGDVVTYTYSIFSPLIDVNGFTLRDVMTPSHTADQRVFVDGTYQGPGTANAYAGTNTLEVSGINVSAGDPLSVSVQVQTSNSLDLLGQVLLNQADLVGLPETVGGPDPVPSDDPSTPAFPDPTGLPIEAPDGCEVQGFLYNDANHNGVRDGEQGLAASQNACMAVFNNVDPTTIIDQVVPAADGSFAFQPLGHGDYTIVVGTGDATACDINALPAGWIPVNPADATWPLRLDTSCNDNVDNHIVDDVELGLFKGLRVDGTVFNDNGIGNGTANDGIQNGAEQGLLGVSINAQCGNTACGSATTNDAGDYSLWISADDFSNDDTIRIIETNPEGHISTWGNVDGATGGYNRAEDSHSFLAQGGAIATNVDFGDVQTNTFASDSVQNVNCGSPAVFGHIFQALSAGDLSFDHTHVEHTPDDTNLDAFQVRYFWDENCNGELDETNATDLTGQAVSLEAGDQLCVLAQVNTPNCAPVGTQVQTEVKATFDYNVPNYADPLVTTLSVTDLTQITGGGSDNEITLRKSVRNITSGGDGGKANPCDILEYRIEYFNPNSSSVPGLVIRDTTPPYTVLKGMPQCPTSSPGCDAVVTNGGDGQYSDVMWQFNNPISSNAKDYVSYRVQVESSGACP